MKRLVIILVLFVVVMSLAVPAALAQSPHVRLWAGANSTAPLAFEIHNGRVRLGPGSAGQIVLTCFGDRIYSGASTNGEILYTVRGDRLYPGPGVGEPAVFTLAGNRIFAGAGTNGDILYTIVGDRISQGNWVSGKPVLTANQDLENSGTMFKLLLPLLVRLSASGPVRLYADPQMTHLLYQYADGRLFSNSREHAILFFDGTAVFRGANATGERLFTVDGDHVLLGSDVTGVVAYTIRDNHVFEGTDEGPVIYTIQGARMFGGASAASELVFQADRSLETSDIRFLLPILADLR